MALSTMQYGFGGDPRAAYSGMPGWAQESDRPDYMKFRSETGGGNFYDFRNWKQNRNAPNESQQIQKTAEKVATMADPFAGQRQQYQQKLSDLLGGGQQGGIFGANTVNVPTGTSTASMFFNPERVSTAQNQLDTLLANPGSIESSPVYQALVNAGTGAVNRTAAAKGMLGSGNRLLELQKVGQEAATQQFFPMAQLLSGRLDAERQAQLAGREMDIRGTESGAQQKIQLADLLGRLSGGYADPSAGARATTDILQLGENARQFNLGPSRFRSFAGGTETTQRPYSVF